MRIDGLSNSADDYNAEEMMAHEEMKQLDDIERATTVTDRKMFKYFKPHENRTITRNFPFCTIGLICIIWVIFLVGLSEIDPTLKHINWKEQISPDQNTWWFYYISPWPQCNNLQSQVWRLISYQFVHEGWLHIFGNTTAAFIYGCILEVYHPFGFVTTFLVFELAVVLGALGFTYLWPYQGLVGCSPGVYGLIGGCWSMILLNKECLDCFLLISLPIILVTQLVLDVLLFTYSYQHNVGYSSHFFGFVTGICLLLGIVGFHRHTLKLLDLIVIILGVTLFIVTSTYLLYNYLAVFPPQPFTSSTLHNELSTQNCCAQLLHLLEQDSSVSKQQIRESYYCQNNELYHY